MSKPDSVLVSVLMTNFNGEKYLESSIQSVLKQTHARLELIVVDDASTDSSADIVKNINDPRVHFVQNEKNSGPGVSSNRGLTLCKGEFIARQDSDDLSLPHRLADQVEFLKSHPEVDFHACGIRSIGADSHSIGKKENFHFWKDSDSLKAELLFETSLPHPAVMFRGRCLKTLTPLYHPEQKLSIDYYLLSHAVVNQHQLAFSQTIGVDYRIHAQNQSHLRRDIQKTAANDIRNTWLQLLNLQPSSAEVALHTKIATYEFDHSLEFVMESQDWLLKILNSFRKQSRFYFSETGLARVLARRWRMVCLNNREIPGIWKIYTHSPLYRLGGESFLADLKLLGQSYLTPFNK